VVEGLLLHRIDTVTTRPAIGCQHHAIVEAPAHKTESPLALVKTTKPGTQIALNPAIVQLVPIADLETLILINRKVGHLQFLLFLGINNL